MGPRALSSHHDMVCQHGRLSLASSRPGKSMTENSLGSCGGRQALIKLQDNVRLAPMLGPQLMPCQRGGRMSALRWLRCLKRSPFNGWFVPPRPAAASNFLKDAFAMPQRGENVPVAATATTHAGTPVRALRGTATLEIKTCKPDLQTRPIAVMTKSNVKEGSSLQRYCFILRRGISSTSPPPRAT